MVRRAVAGSLGAVAMLLTLASASVAGQGTAQLSGFAPLPAFAPSSVWTIAVDGSQPLDPSSGALVSTLLGMVNAEIATGSGPWINTTSYSAPVYDVPVGQSLVPVVLNRTQPYAAALRASFAAGVPIPPGAQPAAGRDEHLVIYQPSSDTMWEFWHAQLVSGVWHADWGGTMNNVSQNPGYFSGAQASWGATATSLPLIDGLITPAELQAGVIDHALAVGLPSTRARVWAFPAQRTDGGDLNANSIPEGARFRLDPTLDLASLNLPPVTLALAQAVQQYGMIVRDETGGVVTFYAQDPTPTGTNPYPQLFGTLTPRQLLASFPWSRLQLLPMSLTGHALMAPVNTVPPAISGSATVGQALAVSLGAWSGTPAPSFSYQWQDCDSGGQNCTTIAGATASTYIVGSGDVGSTIEVVVTAANSAGTATATSAPTAVVSAPVSSAPQNTVAPAISGSATLGQALTVSLGAWSGTPAPSFSYQWQDCDVTGQNCSTVPGATATTYVVGSGDVGSTIDVVVTAANSAGTATAISAPSAVVAPASPAPVNTSPPVISGTATEGQMLTASLGSWSGTPAPSLSDQWQRCNATGGSCAAISGATASTYTLGSADVGSTIAAVVTAANSAGTATADSTPTAVVTSAAGPLTSLLDTFNRPANGGPPGPNWSHMPVGSTSASNNLHIADGQLAGYSGSNADYWNARAYGPNSEVWITVATKPGVDQDPVVLGLRFQNPGLPTAGGYQGYYIYRAGSPDQWKIARTSGSTSTTLASATGPTLRAGDELLFRAIGTTLELWRYDGGAWTRVLVTTSGTYQTAGYLSLTARDTTVRLANFGGGTLP